MSYRCLNENNFDRDSCSEAFQNYRNCRRFWVRTSIPIMYLFEIYIGHNVLQQTLAAALHAFNYLFLPFNKNVIYITQSIMYIICLGSDLRGIVVLIFSMNCL